MTHKTAKAHWSLVVKSLPQASWTGWRGACLKVFMLIPFVQKTGHICNLLFKMSLFHTCVLFMPITHSSKILCFLFKMQILFVLVVGDYKWPGKCKIINQKVCSGRNDIFIVGSVGSLFLQGEVKNIVPVYVQLYNHWLLDTNQKIQVLSTFFKI